MYFNLLCNNSSVRGRIITYELLVQEAPADFKTMQIIAISFEYPPELYECTLLLKTTYTFYPRYVDIKVKFN